MTSTYGLVSTLIWTEICLNNQIITGTHCEAFCRLSCRNWPLGKCYWCGQVGCISYLIEFLQKVLRSHDENITSSVMHFWPYRLWKIFVANGMTAFKQVFNENKKVSSLRCTTWGLEENEKVDEGANSVLSTEKIDIEIPLNSQ